MKNNLKEIRLELNLRADYLASSCGLSKALIHNLEKQDKSSPKLSTAYIIAKVLGRTIQEIWPDTTEVVEETVIMRRITKPKKNRSK